MVMYNFYRVLTKNLIHNATKKYFSKSSYLLGCGENIKNALFVPFQYEPSLPERKISIIGGGGKVGVTILFNLVRHPICDEVALVELPTSRNKLCGEALDFLHARSFMPHTPKLRIGFDDEITEGSDIIIIACGVPRKEGQAISDISQINVDVMKKIIPPLAKLSRDCVFLVVSNPVDLISYAVWRYSCFDKNRVFGTGTSLDKYRFRFNLSKKLGINPYDINADIMGEHGACSVPLWSLAHVAGTKLQEIDKDVGFGKEPNNWKEEHQYILTTEATLHKFKGGSNWAIGKIVAAIAEDIIRDAKTVHYVSLMAKGLLNIDTECFLSFPAVIGNVGIYNVMNQIYSDEEMEILSDAICKLDEEWKALKF